MRSTIQASVTPIPMATTADPATGKQNVDTLNVLETNWGHTDFGVYGEVIQTGMVDRYDGAHIV